MIDRILAKRIIPVVVLESAEDAEPLAEALLEGGLDIMEITFRTAAAEDAIRRCQQGSGKPCEVVKALCANGTPSAE